MPGRRFWKHPIKVARALVHAEIDGDEAAAKKIGCSSRTIRIWRKRFAYEPEVSAQVQILRGQLNQDFLASAKEARSRVLVRTQELVERSTDVKGVAQALIAIQSIVAQEEMIASGIFDQPIATDGASSGSNAPIESASRALERALGEDGSKPAN